MFGITIMKNVKIVERKTDANGKDIVACITAGLGTKCNVNHPLRLTHYINESQQAALAKAQATLPPNFTDRSNKRKADDIEVEDL